MKRILLLSILFFIFVPLFAADYFVKNDGQPLNENASLEKEVKLNLSSTTNEKVKIGFTNQDIEFSHAGAGAFGTVNELDKVNLIINDVIGGIIVDGVSIGYGDAYINENFYVYYQFATNNNIDVYIYTDIYTDGKMKGANYGDTADFIVYRVDSSGTVRKYIDANDNNLGVGASFSDANKVNNHTPSSEGFAWGDSLGLRVVVDASPANGFYGLKGDLYTAKIYAACVVK